MQIHYLLVPVRTPEPAHTEPETLLASMRLRAVHRLWLDDGAESGWAYCIEVQPGAGRRMQANRKVPGALVDVGCRRKRPGWNREGTPP